MIHEKMLSCALQRQKLEFYYLQSNQLHEKWKNLKLINIPTIKLHNITINSYLIRRSVDYKLSEINES